MMNCIFVGVGHIDRVCSGGLNGSGGVDSIEVTSKYGWPALCCGSAPAGRFYLDTERRTVRQEGVAIAESRGSRSRRERPRAKITAPRSFKDVNVEAAPASSASLFSIRLRCSCRRSTANTVRDTPGWENWLAQRPALCSGFDSLGGTCTR